MKLVVAGTQRSGHHAILIWLCNQMGRATEHHNSCILPDFERGEIRRMGNAAAKVTLYGDNAALRKGVIDTYAYSFEAYTFQKMVGIPTSPILAGGPVCYVLVLRDVYNMLASSIKSTVGDNATERLEDRLARWVTHAHNFGNGPWQWVLYNQWVTNKRYRQSICGRLNVPFTDAGIESVSPQGGGSSFTRRKYEGHAQDMDVHNRWKHYVNDPEFLRMVDKPEIAALNKAVFGFDLDTLRNGLDSLQ